MSAEGRFAIAGDLLAGPHGDGRWNNLGYWRSGNDCIGNDYTAACMALARRHAEAIQLGPEDHLLELACGYGASLDLWRDEFAVARLCALERRVNCVASIRARDPEMAANIFHGRFDRPLPEAMPGQHDALICVDAAYHADSLHAFLACAASALKPGGRLAFSTLIKGEVSAAEQKPDWLSGSLLKLAAIPAASRVSHQTLKTQLSASGFDTLSITDISEPVLAGFANWVAHRRRTIPLTRRLSREWLKIEATARLCHALRARKRWCYVVVAAQKRQEVKPSP